MAEPKDRVLYQPSALCVKEGLSMPSWVWIAIVHNIYYRTQTVYAFLLLFRVRYEHVIGLNLQTRGFFIKSRPLLNYF